MRRKISYSILIMALITKEHTFNNLIIKFSMFRIFVMVINHTAKFTQII